MFGFEEDSPHVDLERIHYVLSTEMLSKVCPSCSALMEVVQASEHDMGIGDDDAICYWHLCPKCGYLEIKNA